MRIAAFATVAILAVGVPALAGAAVVGQTDRFESGTTEGWFAGGGPFGQVPPVPPQVVGTGVKVLVSWLIAPVAMRI